MPIDRRMGRDYFLDTEDASDMSRPIYVPIADSFFESSIMREELPVRFVMLALIRLALRAGANGEVDIDPVMFAKSINLPEEQVERAIKRLMEPDRSSSSPDEEGRRIVPIDPERPFRGWRLVNWARYKHIVRMANDAARKRYERAKEEKMDVSENVRSRPQASENVGTKYEIRNTKNEERKSKSRHFVPPTIDEVREFASSKGYTFDPEAFVAYYEARGWKLGRGVMSSWKAACVTWQKRQEKAPPTTRVYPSVDEVKDFNKSMVGANPEHYAKSFRDYFGCDPRKP